MTQSDSGVQTLNQIKLGKPSQKINGETWEKVQTSFSPSLPPSTWEQFLSATSGQYKSLCYYQITDNRSEPVCTMVYQSVPECTKVQQSVPECTRVYQSVQECTKVYQSVLKCTKVYQGASGTSLCDIFLHIFQ